MVTNDILKTLGMALACVGVSACDGDAVPLEEQIEASDLSLQFIEVMPPPNSLDPIFISSNQSLQLSIAGTTFAGNGIFVPADNRRWTTSNSAVLSVSEDGVVVGQSPGTAQVSVTVADSVALEPLTITVSDAPLLGIASINSSADAVGAPSNTLDPCLAETFTAIGDFGANQERALVDVFWSVDPASADLGAETFTTSTSIEGTTLLVGRTPTDGVGVAPITLTATVFADDDTITDTFSSSRELMVDNSLTGFSILPTEESIFAGTEVNLTAPAVYATNPAGFATGGADWSVTEGSQTVTVEGVGENPGLVTGLVAGTATVTASCGPGFSASAVITVTGNLGDLSFNRTGDLVLDLEDGEFDELQVSLGDEFDPALEVTDEAEWESSDTSVLTVDNEGSTRGDLTLLSVGISEVSAEFDTTRISITVEVQ